MISSVVFDNVYTGTDAEHTAFVPDVTGTIFLCTDTGDAFWWDGAAWQGMGGGGGADPNAIHVNAANEISGIANKVAPAAGDMLVIEDSAAGNIKKMVLVSSLNLISIRETIFTYSGNIVLGGGLLRIYNKTGVTQTITNVFICVTTAPTGATLIVDIHKDGVTIFTNQAHRPEIAIAAFTATDTGVDVPAWADGSYLTAIIDQIGSTITGANLTVHVIHHS
jgi:hypothetical protein